MANSYQAFVRSYYTWSRRMSPGGWHLHSPPESLAAFQAVNFFSILLWLKPPAWLAVGLAVLAGICLFFVNRAALAQIELHPSFPKWSDNAPSFREFPSVYLYLLGSFFLLFGSAVGAYYLAP